MVVKIMFVVTTAEGPIAIAKTAVAVVVPMGNGSKIVTNLVKSHYENYIENVTYCVKESAQEVIHMMNSNN